MRISTAQIYATNVSTIGRQQSNLLHLQQEISTGKRVLTPSDDPVAAARALEVEQSVSLNTMRMDSQGAATDALKSLDSRLGSINEILNYVKERAIQAGNSKTLSVADKQGIAADISAQFDELLSEANTKDSSGEYVFSGYKADTRPFAGNLAGVTYQGDKGSQMLQISNSRQIPVNVNGEELFMKIDDGKTPAGTTDMFSIVSNLVTTLKDPTISATAYDTGIATALQQLSNASDNVLRLRSQTGSRMVEVDALTSMGQDLNIQYADSIKRLVGVDYASTISDYQQQNTYLEAARTTYSQISKMSLFNYIGN